MSQNRVIAIAVLATGSTCLIVAGIVFYFFYRYSMGRQRERSKYCSSFRRETTTPSPCEELMQHGGTLRGLLVEENGRDVLYLRKAEGGRFTSCFSKVWFNPITEEDKEIDDRGLKPSISSPTHTQKVPLISEADHTVGYFSSPDQEIPLISMADCTNDSFSEVKKPMQFSGTSNLGPVPPPLVIPSKQITPPPPPPPPPLSNKMQLKPPPPPPPPIRKDLKPPAPPPLKMSSKPPASQFQSKTKPGSSLPLPPKPAGSSSSPLKPPAHPSRGKLTTNNGVKTPDLESSNGRGDSTQMKLKPLHWDKVPTNAEYSMVWHEIVDGSFRFDDKLIESLFGYAAQKDNKSEARNVSVSSAIPSAAQLFLLEPRKSQNTAIVLKSLAISRKEILDALQEGYGLSTDTLEKLTKITPTPEEAAKIVQFDGNPTKLADAESFLYHILKAVPSAFLRINAMLFRSNYDPDILHLKESLQTLELSCKEVRNRGVFFKLLEAILKAGNRMNAGTARGDAQGFNLSALRKLSYVKSTDGKTTLLQFVVEQVIRSEGKRCANDQDGKFGDDQDLDIKTTKEEDDREYIMLGLPIVAGLSREFSNVKKAATIDHESFINMCPTLTTRAREIRQVVLQCGSSEKGGFAWEMKGFLEECEEELKVVREEQTRVMQLVKRTTEYYQAGAAKEKGTDPLQLFAIVKDFLGMVDQVCEDISKKLLKKRVTSAGSSPLSLSPRTPVRFQNFQSFFQAEKRGTMSDESEDDF